MGKYMNKSKASKFSFERINKVFFALLAIFVTLPSLIRGGYFVDDIVPILLAFNIVLLIYLFIQDKNKNYSPINTPIELLFIGIVVMYLLSTIYGVSKKGSIIEFIKYFSYLGYMIMAYNLSSNTKMKLGILDAMIIGSIFITAIGIGTMAGTWEYTGALIGNRFSSTFQYPNTLAAYVSGIYILSLTLLSNEENRLKKILYGMGVGSCLFSLILTYSRAMWLMFPLLLIIYFIFIPNTRKFELIIYIISTAIAPVPAAFLTTKLGEFNSMIWAIYIAAIVGSGLFAYITSFLDKRYRQFSTKKLFVLLSLIVIIVVVLGIYAINSTTEINLSNETEEDKLTVLNRNVTKTEQNTEYSLQVTYKGYNGSESPYLGRVIIYNLDENGAATQLHSEIITSIGENILQIPFTTLEDSLGVRVRFDNFYKDTSFVVLKSSITKVKIDNETIDIPLKYKYIPESIVSRFNSINAGETNLIRRISFNLDGINIIKDYPILGAGAEGWRFLYERYQSEAYASNLAHNYFLQLWIEIGLIGFLLMFILLFTLTTVTIKSFRKTENINSKALILGLYMTILTMLVHAFVDFDMSLAGYAIIVWVCIGVLLNELDFGENKLEKIVKKINKKSRITNRVLIMLSIIITLTLSSLMIGEYYAEKAVKANESNSIGKVASNFEKAVQYDRFEPSYMIDLSNTYMVLYNSTKNQEYVLKAIEQVNNYLESAPESLETNFNASRFYLSIGEIEKGLEYLERSVEIQPLRANSYTNKLNGYFALFEHYLSKGEEDKAIGALGECLNIKEQIAETNKKSIRPIAEDIGLVYSYGKAKFFFEHIDNLLNIAERGLILDFAYYFENINGDDKIDMLRESKPSGSNIDYEVIEDEQQYIRLTNTGEKSGFIYPYGIKLEPDSKYVVDIKARGTVEPGTFKSYAVSSGAKDPIQGGIEGIELTDQWKTYSFEFITDSDIQPGKQYIRLQHNGNDSGFIDIEGVVIYRVRD